MPRTENESQSMYEFNTQILKIKRKENLSVTKTVRQSNTNLINFVKPAHHNHLIASGILIKVFQVGNNMLVFLCQNKYKIMHLKTFKIATKKKSPPFRNFIFLCLIFSHHLLDMVLNLGGLVC